MQFYAFFPLWTKICIIRLVFTESHTILNYIIQKNLHLHKKNLPYWRMKTSKTDYFAHPWVDFCHNLRLQKLYHLRRNRNKLWFSLSHDRLDWFSWLHNLRSEFSMKITTNFPLLNVYFIVFIRELSPVWRHFKFRLAH